MDARRLLCVVLLVCCGFSVVKSSGATNQVKANLLASYVASYQSWYATDASTYLASINSNGKNPLKPPHLTFFSLIRFSGSNSSHNPFFILSSRFFYLQDRGRMLITRVDVIATEQHGPRQHT